MKKYSKDKKVVFYEDNHTYYLGEKRLNSITKYISTFKPIFDKEATSKLYALKHNLDQQQVLKDWENKGKESMVMGSYVHKVFEEYILNKTIIDTSLYPKCKTALKFISDYFESDKIKPVETEYIVYNKYYAGQIDCIVQNDKGEYFILDWKTNEEIKMGNRWQSMKYKFKQYDDCSFNHYSIQLRAYQEMCKEYNIKDCFIVHLKEDDYEFITARDIKPF
jgi:ATP-dependent exoDNAse (exonuclease V) beta subunit